MTARMDWALLAYRMPREPSTPRIAVWRKLRSLGVAQIVDGLIALPADARTREQLDWLADEVLDAGGEATVWIGRPSSAAQERAIARRMADVVAEDYRRLIDAAQAAEREPDVVRRRALARLRRECRRIAQRDFFPPAEADQARRALVSLAELVEVSA